MRPWSLAIFALLVAGAGGARTQSIGYDVVIANGRVMDPESGLDAVRSLGIRDGKIAAISAGPLQGKQLIDELIGFSEIVSSTIGNRTAFVRAFSAGRSIAEMTNGGEGHREIALLCDLVETTLVIMQAPSKT